MEYLSEKDMKILLKKTERQVLALKGELKDYEWRLDQESAVSVELMDSTNINASSFRTHATYSLQCILTQTGS